MRLGLFISALLHAAILGWVVISIANTPPVETDPVKRINVDIVQTAEVTKLREGVRKPKKPKKAEKPTPPVKKAKPKVKPAIKKVAVLPPAKKPEPKKPEPKKVEKKPEPPKPEPKKVEKPKPKPVVEKPKPKKVAAKPKPKPVKKVSKPKPKPKPKKVAKAKPRIEPKPPARKRDPKFDPNNIAALLNRLPNAQSEPQPRVERFARRNESPTPPREQLGQRDGRDQQLSVSEKDRLLSAIVRQVEQCWSPPTGVREARNLIPRVKFSLRKNGSLVGQPEVMNPVSTSLFIAASSAAVRAVYECQPYRLPQELYANWQSVILNFDPKEMLGG